MLLTKRFILALTLCFAGVGVFAQSANDIVNKYIDAMGGKAKLEQLNSVYEEISTSAMGQEIPGKVWIVNNKGMRTEMSVMNQKIVTVMTKDTGWMVNPLMGNSDPQPLPIDQVKESASKLDLRGQLLDYAAKGYTLTLLGKEAVAGKDNFKLKLVKGGQAFTFFIDASTYLITKVAADAKISGQDINTEVEFSDYKKTAEGYTFPNTTTIHMNAGAAMEVKSVITKVTVNPTVDPQLFLKP